VDVTGAVQLAGTLRIDSSNLANFSPDTTVEIIAAGSLTGTFDNVEWIGNEDAAQFFYPEYDYVNGIVSLSSVRDGDMNDDGSIMDNRDKDLFVFALLNSSIDKWWAECPECVLHDVYPQHHGDFNGNGWLDFDDIPGFQARLPFMGMSDETLQAAFDRYFSNVPEPSHTLLWLSGCVLLTARRRPNRLAVFRL
jgi:hypothetical protein